MFTGIVEAVGTIRNIGAGRLRFEAPAIAARLAIGDSVAVNGVCLTAVAVEGACVSADVSPETLSKTTLGRLHAGSRVNLETALTLSKPLGGHLLTGHTDCPGTVLSVDRVQDSRVLRLAFPEAFASLVVDRGSIGVDGVSLTVAAVEENAVRLALIPQTVRTTTLEDLAPGSIVNIEFDILGKYVQRRLECLSRPDGEGEPPPLTFEGLRGLGF